MPNHPLWWLTVWACVAWYTLITSYVAWKGIADIRQMLRRLSDRRPEK